MTRPLLLCIALLAALPAMAATPIDQTRPLDPTGTVEIENLKGRIEVRAWDRPEVKIEGSLGAGAEKLEIEGDRSRLEVRVRYPKEYGMFNRGRGEPTELRLMVPLRASLDVGAVAADVDVQGLAAGEMSIDSVSGDVTVAAAPRKADINSVSGDLDLTLNSSDIQAETVSGLIRLRGRLNGEVEASSVSGDIELGTLDTQLRRLEGSTVSGDMRVATALADAGRISLDTVSGSLRLTLPKSLSANVRGETFSGDLEATGARIERAEHGPGASFTHRYGQGSGDISVETFSGSATIVVE